MHKTSTCTTDEFPFFVYLYLGWKGTMADKGVNQYEIGEYVHDLTEALNREQDEEDKEFLREELKMAKEVDEWFVSRGVERGDMVHIINE